MAFKSNDRTFEKVYGIFDKRDYFNAKGLAKVQIGNFERALQKNDKGAQQILDKFNGDMDKAKEYIIQVITDRKKEEAFNQYKAFKAAVDSIQKGKPIYGAVDLVKSRIHNSSQKYTIALYSALRNKKFTKWKDVHNDVDSLIGESVNEGPSFKIKNTISKKEWAKTHKDYKTIIDGVPYVMKLTNKGTALVPVKIEESINEEKVYIDFLNKKKGFRQDRIKFNSYESAVKWAKKNFEKFNPDMIKFESVNEAMKPSQVRSAISKVKKGLMRKWKQKGGYENFGQKELSQMKDKFDYNPYGSPDERQISKMLDGFDNWAMNYDGNMREDKAEVEQIAKKTKSETAFYDVLSKIEQKYGKRNYRMWLEKSLKDLGVNSKHYDYRTNAAAEEKLYQLTK